MARIATCANSDRRRHRGPQRCPDRSALISCILIPPYTPRWNGKIERFFGTLDSEWAHGRTWPDSVTRDRALASFLRFYNRRRPHSARRRPTTHQRVHQVRRQDI